MKIKEAIEYFMTEQQLRGNTRKTVKNYQTILNWFNDYLQTNMNLENIDGISLLHINKYHLYLRQKNMKGRSIQTYLRHIRAFLRFCYNEGLLPQNIMEKFTLPKAEKPVFEILTMDEISLLLSSFPKTEIGSRNHAICWIMLDCGLREEEVCQLKISDINFSNGYARIERGKGQKGRLVPLGLRCRKVLTDYLYKRRLAIDVTSDYMFLSKYRTGLTPDIIVSFFTKLKKKTGISRIHAHLLRHTFATNYLLDSHGDIYQLGQILGHTDIKTTQIYLHAANYYRIIESNRNSTYMDKNFK